MRLPMVPLDDAQRAAAPVVEHVRAELDQRADRRYAQRADIDILLTLLNDIERTEQQATRHLNVQMALDAGDRSELYRAVTYARLPVQVPLDDQYKVYPNGYRVTDIQGARVISEPNAPLLRIENTTSDEVTLELEPRPAG